MVRIIPWKLPDVAGGSIGGYTPAPTPEPPTPDPDPLYIAVDDVVVPNNFKLGFKSTNFSAGVPKTVTVDEVNSSAGNLTVSGIETINLVGVSQISVKIEGSASDAYMSWTYDDILLDVNPATLATSFISGTTTVTTVYSPTGVSWTGTNTPASVTTITFYVYNGNGEIIQTAVVGGGE